MKMKLVVTTQTSLVNTALKYKNAIRKVSGLEIKRIAPLHGPIWRTPETIEYILHKYLHWSSYTAEKKGVVIAFGSMYGNTRDIAQQLAKQLSKRGVTDIKNLRCFQN